MSGVSYRLVTVTTMLLLAAEASGAHIGRSDDQKTSPLLSILTGAVIFAVATGWVLVSTAAGATMRNTDQVPTIPFPNLTPCSTTGNALKNLLEVVFVFPCCASLKCSFTIGIWLARGSPLVVLLKVALASLSSGTVACVLGYVGAYLARDNSPEIQVTWDSLSDDRVKRMIPPPASPSPHKYTLIQACLVASLPLMAIACVLPLFNGIVTFLTPKVGRVFSLCLVTGITILLAAGVFLTAFSVFLLGPGTSLTRHKRAAFTSAEVESLLGIDLPAISDPLSLPPSPDTTSETSRVPTPTLPNTSTEENFTLNKTQVVPVSSPDTAKAASLNTSVRAGPTVSPTERVSLATVNDPFTSPSPLNTSTEENFTLNKTQVVPVSSPDTAKAASLNTSVRAGPTVSPTERVSLATVNDPFTSPSPLNISKKVLSRQGNHSTTLSAWLDSAQSWLAKHSPETLTQFSQNRGSLLGACLAVLLACRIVATLYNCRKTCKKDRLSRDICKIRTQLKGLNDHLSSFSDHQPSSNSLEMEGATEVMPPPETAEPFPAPPPPPSFSTLTTPVPATAPPLHFTIVFRGLW